MCPERFLASQVFVLNFENSYFGGTLRCRGTPKALRIVLRLTGSKIGFFTYFTPGCSYKKKNLHFVCIFTVKNFIQSCFFLFILDFNRRKLVDDPQHTVSEQECVKRSSQHGDHFFEEKCGIAV